MRFISAIVLLLVTVVALAGQRVESPHGYRVGLPAGWSRQPSATAEFLSQTRLGPDYRGAFIADVFTDGSEMYTGHFIVIHLDTTAFPSAAALRRQARSQRYQAAQELRARRVRMNPEGRFVAEWDDVDEVLWSSQQAISPEGVLFRYVAAAVESSVGEFTVFLFAPIRRLTGDADFLYMRGFLSEFLYHLEFAAPVQRSSRTPLALGVGVAASIVAVAFAIRRRRRST